MDGHFHENQEASMSTFDSDDGKTIGYFLPEDSQLRLKKLRVYAEFLSHIAQPRTPDVAQESIPEINVGQVAICLELLAEQVELVLDDVSFPAYRPESETARVSGTKPEATDAMLSDADGRYIFGMTREQTNALSRLIDRISAHGDGLTASNDATATDNALSLLGHAIAGDAKAARAIIRQVASQRLASAQDSPTGVGEERAAYHAGRACLPAARAAASAPMDARDILIATLYFAMQSRRTLCRGVFGRRQDRVWQTSHSSFERKPLLPAVVPAGVFHGRL